MYFFHGKCLLKQMEAAILAIKLTFFWVKKFCHYGSRSVARSKIVKGIDRKFNKFSKIFYIFGKS